MEGKGAPSFMREDTIPWEGNLEGTKRQSQSKFLPSPLDDLGLQGLGQQFPQSPIFWLQIEHHTTSFVFLWLRLGLNHADASLGPWN